MNKVETDGVSAKILEESQDLVNQIFTLTVCYYQEQILRGSPSELMQNTALLEQMNRPHLMRLCFLAGVEYQLKLEQRLAALRID